MHKRRPVQLLVRFACAALLAGALLGGIGPAQAADPMGPSADQAVQLVDRPLAGHLDADQYGRFAFYKFWYPSDGSTATVNVQIKPDDVYTMQKAGMFIYNPEGTIVVNGGQQRGVVPNVSGNVIVNNPQKKGFYTVQVFNYNPQTAVDFTIWITGVPVPPASSLGSTVVEPTGAALPPPTPGQTVTVPTIAPAASAAAPAAPAAGVPAAGPVAAAPAAPPPPTQVPAGPNDTADRAVQLQPGATESGDLAGSTGGSFAYYKLEYPGDRSTVTINVNVTPDDPALIKNAGFRVFGPAAGRTYATSGYQRGIDPNLSANLITSDSGTFVVQLYNYNQQAGLHFTLTTANLPPQPAAAPAAPAPPVPAPPVPAPPVPAAPTPAAPAAAPAPPATPTPTAPASSEPSSLGGQNSFTGHLSPGGGSALYEFTYPGDLSVYTIGLNIAPNDPQVAKNASFKVYGPIKGKVYAQGGYQGGIVPNQSGNVISKDAGNYVIQVYNFSSTPVDYTLTLATGKPPSELATPTS
ncbi:MAG TPA: hypothetical protein VFC93_10910 [Chloroflexota bacterium]|nr:hypothetical protein [Chloroflexota bacterium]